MNLKSLSSHKIAPTNKDIFVLLENLIVCKFDAYNAHILCKPVILPCGNTGKKSFYFNKLFNSKVYFTTNYS